MEAGTRNTISSVHAGSVQEGWAKLGHLAFRDCAMTKYQRDQSQTNKPKVVAAKQRQKTACNKRLADRLQFIEWLALPTHLCQPGTQEEFAAMIKADPATDFLDRSAR